MWLVGLPLVAVAAFAFTEVVGVARPTGDRVGGSIGLAPEATAPHVARKFQESPNKD